PNPAIRYVDPLSQLLADPHPEVRQFVCECLFEWCDISDPGMNEAIRDAAMNVLEGDRWQGQEQAALLLGALEHEPAADRLIELLESPREEVRVPAAWGLRKVAN